MVAALIRPASGGDQGLTIWPAGECPAAWKAFSEAGVATEIGEITDLGAVDDAIAAERVAGGTGLGRRLRVAAAAARSEPDTEKQPKTNGP